MPTPKVLAQVANVLRKRCFRNYYPGGCHLAAVWVSRRIVLTAGRSLSDQRTCLIHELTHHIRGSEGGSSTHHPAAFYATEFRLANLYGVPVRMVKKNEGVRKPRNVNAGYRMYLRQQRGA